MVRSIYDVKGDVAGAHCAACGDTSDYRKNRELVRVEGIRLMLCTDWRSCKLRVKMAAGSERIDP
jgi:hypothetical protein